MAAAAYFSVLPCCYLLGSALHAGTGSPHQFQASGIPPSTLYRQIRTGHLQRMSSKQQVCSGPCRPTRRQGLSTASGHPGSAGHSTAQPAPLSCMEGAPNSCLVLHLS